jgi:hypothetical protein
MTREEVLTLALKLAITAPSDESAAAAKRIAESIASDMDATTVDTCKAIALAEIATEGGELMPDTNARTVVTIGDKTYYIDDSTGEAIMEWWPVTGREQDRTTCCPECATGTSLNETGTRCWNCEPEEGA